MGCSACSGSEPLHIDFKQGTKQSIPFELGDENGQPVDLTNAKATMQFRKTAAGPIVWEATLDFGDDPTEGILTSTVDDPKFEFPAPAQGIWDILLELDDGSRQRLYEGSTWSSTPGVSRPK